MFLQSRRLVFLLAGAACRYSLAQTAQPPTTYSVTEINSMFGPETTMEIVRDGDRAVVDQSSAVSPHLRTFYDLKTGKTHGLNLTRPGAPCGAGTFTGDWGDPFAMSAELAKLNPKTLGDGTVNGIAARMLEAVVPGQAAPAKIAVDPKYGMILKLEMGGKTMIEVRKVSFAKPPASALALPAACSGVSAPPSEAGNIAAATGGNAADFADATMPPASPSADSCTVLFRVVSAGAMKTVTTGFQVALDPTVNLENPANYQMGVGPGGRTTFSGGGLKELTSQLRNGVLRIESAPARFDLELAFGNGGSSSALIYRQCFGPQTTLLFVVKNPAKVSDGTNYWLWDKTGKRPYM